MTSWSTSDPDKPELGFRRTVDVTDDGRWLLILTSLGRHQPGRTGNAVFYRDLSDVEGQEDRALRRPRSATTSYNGRSATIGDDLLRGLHRQASAPNATRGGVRSRGATTDPESAWKDPASPERPESLDVLSSASRHRQSLCHELPGGCDAHEKLQASSPSTRTFEEHEIALPGPIGSVAGISAEAEDDTDDLLCLHLLQLPERPSFRYDFVDQGEARFSKQFRKVTIFGSRRLRL